MKVGTKQIACCFAKHLDKALVVGGKKQLGRDFGTAENPDCSGLSLNDLRKIDISKIDLTEFMQEVAQKVSNINIDEAQIKADIEDAVIDMEKEGEGIEAQMEELENSPTQARRNLLRKTGHKQQK